MGNLSTREKAFIYVILLLLIIVGGYFLGIRNLNNQYNEYKTQLDQLNARKALRSGLICGMPRRYWGASSQPVSSGRW